MMSMQNSQHRLSTSQEGIHGLETVVGFLAVLTYGRSGSAVSIKAEERAF
jgi:hypothetical protein